MTPEELVGKEFVFEDGQSIKIIQTRKRDDGPWITAHAMGAGIPRQITMPFTEFVDTYGHLFEAK
jgi:hypothetical protein